MNYRKTFSRIILIAWSTIAVMFVMCSITPYIAQAKILFKARIDYAAGDAPYSVAIGDLNGDGDLDLAAASVSILINTGGYQNQFVDVPPGYWAEEYIYKIYETGITKGCSQDPLMYCPEKAVNHDQMAVFLSRATHDSNFTPPDATGVFADVPVWYWAADWIEKLYNEGITKGCKKNPLMYCPEMHVTRAQMAKFLARMLGL